jgi:HipA-like protein
MDNELHVFLNEEHIGTLTQENGAISFAYAPDYLHDSTAYPLSQLTPFNGANLSSTSRYES